MSTSTSTWSALTSVVARRWSAIGTTCEVLCTDQGSADAALTLARQQVERLDHAASRFRADSEVSCLPHGTAATVSPTLDAALAASLDAARRTDGLVDPTVGAAMAALGYDTDLAVVRARPVDTFTGRRDGATGPDGRPEPQPAPGWWRVHHDRRTREVLVPHGVELDLGAVAKAWAADEIAAELARELPGGFLVNLGGDLAVSGATPIGGWRVRVDDGSGREAPVVALRTGGAATSSTTGRTWRAGGELRHHIVDPRTGRPPEASWRCVTATARTAALANTAATAAVVLGAEAPEWLEARGVHARMVDRLGRVVRVGAWPADLAEECTAVEPQQVRTA